jgi:hypothetical protein
MMNIPLISSGQRTLSAGLTRATHPQADMRVAKSLKSKQVGKVARTQNGVVGLAAVN